MFGAQTVGGRTRTISKDFESHEKAITEMHKMITSKRRTGYAEPVYD
jgi:predicted DNA-binding WGR domain protein